jgi:nanoRNase/pAp phosphatase (c-di-AMP/oligoRNAs hydrolase)
LAGRVLASGLLVSLTQPKGPAGRQRPVVDQTLVGVDAKGGCHPHPLVEGECPRVVGGDAQLGLAQAGVGVGGKGTGEHRRGQAPPAVGGVHGEHVHIPGGLGLPAAGQQAADGCIAGVGDAAEAGGEVMRGEVIAAKRSLKVSGWLTSTGGMPSRVELPLDRTYRLVTRSDFDGLVCAALLKELGIIDDILFVHPKDVQDGKVELTAGDITTNLPYRSEVALAFDHHSSEQLRVAAGAANRVMIVDADSAARVVYDHFGGAERFPRVSAVMMEAVDRADAAKLSMDDILNPQGWILLSYLMDPRTGLGRFREFRISNYQLMMQLIDCCLTMSIEDILESPDVAERVALYREHADAAAEQIRRASTVHDHVVVLDLRDEEIIHLTNRFLLYALYPECRVSIHVLWGLRQQNTVFAVGRSIVDRSSQVDIGALMLAHGGGGHEAAGTCQIANEDAEAVLAELVETIAGAEREPVTA